MTVSHLTRTRDQLWSDLLVALGGSEAFLTRSVSERKILLEILETYGSSVSLLTTDDVDALLAAFVNAAGGTASHLRQSKHEMLAALATALGGTAPSASSSSTGELLAACVNAADTGGGGGGYVASAVHLDGATQLRSAGEILSGTSSRGLLSVWRYSTVDDLTNPPMLLALQGYKIEFDFGFFNEPEPLLQDFSFYLNGDSGEQYNVLPVHSIATTGWTNWLFAWDMNFPAGEKICQIYINGTATTAELGLTDSNDAFEINYAGRNLTVFGDAGTNSLILGDFAEFYFAPGQFLDLTNGANVAKFIAAGKPVSLGSDGSLPTGTAPAVFFSGDATGFATNKGSGGAFALTGSLTTATTSPSD